MESELWAVGLRNEGWGVTWCGNPQGKRVEGELGGGMESCLVVNSADVY